MYVLASRLLLAAILAAGLTASAAWAGDGKGSPSGTECPYSGGDCARCDKPCQGSSHGCKSHACQKETCPAEPGYDDDCSGDDECCDDDCSGEGRCDRSDAARCQDDGDDDEGDDDDADDCDEDGDDIQCAAAEDDCCCDGWFF